MTSHSTKSSMCLVAVVLSFNVIVFGQSPDEPSEKTSTEQSGKDRGNLRFATRSFDQWRETLRADLDDETRQRAVHALSVFARHGYENESFVEITTALKNDKSAAVQQSAFDALARFTATRPTEVMDHVIERVGKHGVSSNRNGRQNSIEVQIIARLLRTHTEPTAKRLVELTDSDESNIELRVFGCRELCEWRTLPDESGEPGRMMLPAAEFAAEAIPVFVKLSNHKDPTLRGSATSALAVVAASFNAMAPAKYYLTPQANLHHFQCAKGIKARLSDSEPSIRELSVNLIATNGIDQPQDLTKPLLAELNNQTKSVLDAVANFEDPTDIWVASERALVASRNQPQQVPADTKTPNLVYTADLIRALGIQQERAESAIPLLKTLKTTLQTSAPAAAQTRNARSGRSTFRLSHQTLATVIDQALAAIDGSDAEAVERLKTSTSARDLLNRLRRGAVSGRSSFGSGSNGFGGAAPVNRFGSQAPQNQQAGGFGRPGRP